MALLAVAAHAAAAGVINSVETKRVGEGIVISVNGTGLTAPKEERAWRNQTYILSFDAKMMARASRSAVNFGGVEYVQWTQFTVRPMVSRVVLRLRPTDQPVLKETSTGWTISVNISGNTTPDTTGTVNGGTTTRSTTDNIELHPTTRPANGDTIPRVVASGVVTPSSGAVLLGNSGVAADKRVSLNFESTEVVLILKALAAQAGVNIVTSPDVKGAISVQFDNVTVDHALQVITAISGLRYQRLENTIIVAPSDKLMQIIANVTAGSGGAVGPSQTRIVPIFSHQGRQIKSALYRVMPQDGSAGRYDLVLQSEQTMPNPLTGESGAVNPGGAPAGSPAPPTSPTTTANDSTDEYIMIIGTPKRLDEVENMIHEVDTQLCNALGVEIPSTLGTVQETYTVKGATAAKLLEALGVKDGKLGGVSLVATPVSSSSPQNIVVSGKANDVRRVLAMLGEMDAPPAINEGYEVYEVAFMDPRGLRDELMQQIPGLRVSVPPAGAGATRLYQPVTYSNSGGNGGAANGGAATGGSTGGGSTSGGGETGAVGGSSGLKSGLSQPFAGLEPVAVPMRLVLRGSREAISHAYDLLKKLDVAPAQCALELRVMQLSKEDAISAGIDWNLFTGGAVKFLRLNNSVPDLHNSGGVSINDRNISGDVVAALDKVANSSNLISRPNLVAYDGRETEIFIGDVIRYVESITSSQNGPSVQIGEVRVGVNLAVLARVSSDGTATLDLRPTVSSLKGFTKVSVQGFAADLPQTTETVSQNTVAVKDGETIAIGGLITDEVTKRATGVPILMDLPILGNLFRSTVTGRNRRELVIFVTTRKINGPLGADSSTIPMRDGQNPPAGNP